MSMINLSRNYGELGETDARYNVKPRTDLLELLDSKPSSILELGCADGTNLLFFKERLAAAGIDVQRLVGVDSQRIRHCPNYDAFNFVHSTVEDFVDRCHERFELIILSDIVEHLYNPWHTIRALRENLHRGARLLVSVPNLQNIRYVLAVASGQFHYEASGLMDITHIRFFSAETLTSLLKDAGFAVRRGGYRPDFSLSNELHRWRMVLAAGEQPVVSVGSCTIAVSQQNIDLLTAQQLLVCASKEGD